MEKLLPDPLKLERTTLINLKILPHEKSKSSVLRIEWNFREHLNSPYATVSAVQVKLSLLIMTAFGFPVVPDV